ncbi:MAG: hypothetical protein Q8Q01_04815 [archaeon]|nr:hypothetical protein [archaeon]
MDSYLLEYRFSGYPQKYIKEKYRKIKWGYLVGSRKHRFVPHITIAGPIKASSQSALIKKVEDVIYKYSDYIKEKGHLVKSDNYMFFTTIDGRNAIAIKIIPPKPLMEMKRELEKITNKGLFNNCKTYDENLWHSTLLLARRGNNYDNQKIKTIWSKVRHEHPKTMQFILDRITLMKNKRILKEFDLVHKETLSREVALDNNKRYQAYIKIRDELQANGEMFKYSNGIKANNIKDNDGFKEQEYLVVPIPNSIEQIDLDKLVKEKSSFLRKAKVFCTSDQHFDHKNIIRYCKRPFKNVKIMNQVLMDNWNKTIKKRDIVLFLGDMSFGKGSRSADYWLSKLNGNIFFIRGFEYKASGERNQHDVITRKENVFDYVIVKYKNTNFFLVHDPEQVPNDWKDWAICGHHHNNKPSEFPLINKKNKKMNVSVEFTDYKPILLDDLMEKIK